MRAQGIFAVLMFLSFFCECQIHELELDYRVGISTKRFTQNHLNGKNNYRYRDLYTLNDQGVILEYKFKVSKRYKIFLSSGLEFSSTKHLLPLYGSQRIPRILGNIEIVKNRIGFRILGVQKNFSIVEDKLDLRVAFSFVKRKYLRDVQNYYSDFKRGPVDWIEFEYDITTYNGVYENSSEEDIKNGPHIYLNSDYSVDLNYRLSKKFSLNFGFDYSRKNLIFYNYEYKVNYYQGGSQTPTESYSFLGVNGLFDAKKGHRDDFIYIRTGLSYCF